MSLLADHFVLMLVHATLLAGFLALLWREEPRAVRRFFLRTWFAMSGAALVLAWLLDLPGR